MPSGLDLNEHTNVYSLFVLKFLKVNVRPNNLKWKLTLLNVILNYNYDKVHVFSKAGLFFFFLFKALLGICGFKTSVLRNVANVILLITNFKFCWCLIHDQFL